MKILGLILGLGLLMLLVYKRIPTLIAALVASLVVGLFNGIDVWTSINTLCAGIGSTFGSYVLVFVLATVYGEILVEVGCTKIISDSLLKLFGVKNAVIIIILITSILTYGGVSGMVVAFTAVPISIPILKKANISKTLLPAMIMIGEETFPLTALPGSPQLNNIIPTEVLGTTTWAGPILGLVASVILFGLGAFYLQKQAERLDKKGIHFSNNMDLEEDDVVDEHPNLFIGYSPLLVMFVLNFVFEHYVLFGYSFPAHGAYTAVNSAMFISTVYACILGIINHRTEGNKVYARVKNGITHGINTILAFATVVGFGSVVKITGGFAQLVDLVINIDAPSYVSAAIAVGAIAMSTGSASGGLKIACSTEPLVNSWLADTTINRGSLHRIISVASGGLDSLPQAGGILATLEVCGETHESSYKHIFVCSCIFPIIAAAVIIGLAMLGIS